MIKTKIFVESRGVGDAVFDKLKELVTDHPLVKFVTLKKYTKTAGNKKVVKAFEKQTK